MKRVDSVVPDIDESLKEEEFVKSYKDIYHT